MFQVPKGWDKLQVSVVPINIGKVTAKTGKAPVKDGSCQWSDALLESIHVSQDSYGEDNSKELYKFILSTVPLIKPFLQLYSIMLARSI